MNLKVLSLAAFVGFGLAACNQGGDSSKKSTKEPAKKEAVSDSEFEWKTEEFADVKILRYRVPGWDKLSSDQKKLVYYLNQAGLSGRDIMYDQNYRHNLEIRSALERIYEKYAGDKSTEDWKSFEKYLKQVWFANGIHHHYSNMKFTPGFSAEYFEELLSTTETMLSEEAKAAILDPSVDPKKVEQKAEKGLLESSAINFYAPDVTTEEAKAFYAEKTKEKSRTPISYGLNSRLEKDENGELYENVWKVGGLYSPAIEEIVYWLKKAEGVAENDKQAAAFRKLIEYYETGKLRTWDDYNIQWVQATEGDIDYINGFVEVYNDPLGMRGSYETIVQIKDFEASDRMSTLMENAQYFEDNSPFMDAHKRDSVVGITYNVVNVAGEAGDASPSTPIGVNLPNANWIRAKFGSKSVSLGNIVYAYEMGSGEGMLKEFAHDEEEVELSEKHGSIASKLHTALHEVIGHASGQLEEGVGQPAETLQNYASTIEEGRADLVALYFMMDPKMVDLGLMESLDVAKAEYNSYILNGLMLQLRRLEPNADIEEAHMRNRAWVSHWVFEKGKDSKIIEEVKRDGETYYDINDYEKLRELFGELLQEVQRIKSQGDYEAAKNLVENYGVKVDPEIHSEVLKRVEALDIPPYGGFINPQMKEVTDENGELIDVEMTFPKDFAEQMMYYSKNYNYLSESAEKE
ncbi:dipeptidyl-peptidase 3 family protein [Halocola ammonii]